MNTWTPVDRLRPLQTRPRIDFGNDEQFVIRQGGIRLDPSVTPQERWMDARFWPAVEGIGVWIVAPVFLWWAIIEGSKLVYQFAFNHPFFH